jgi:hypothetical protein
MNREAEKNKDYMNHPRKKISASSTYLSIITSNLSGLNSLIKMQFESLSQKTRFSYFMFAKKKTYFIGKDTQRLKMKDGNFKQVKSERKLEQLYAHLAKQTSRHNYPG